MFQGMRRVQIAASDFSRSRRFYGEVLGLPESGGFEKDWVEFSLGPVRLKVVPMRPGEVASRNHVAIVLSTDALDRALSGLKERGVTVARVPVDEFTGRSAEILDPDGYRIIVFQPSELHPDEEWVPMSRIDDLVRERVEAERLFPGRRKKPVSAAKAKEAEKKAREREKVKAQKAREAERKKRERERLAALKEKEAEKKARERERVQAQREKEAARKKAERERETARKAKEREQAIKDRERQKALKAKEAARKKAESLKKAAAAAKAKAKAKDQARAKAKPPKAKAKPKGKSKPAKAGKPAKPAEDPDAPADGESGNG